MESKDAIFPQDELLFPPVEHWSRLLVSCRRRDYSASALARAVEDCDAHLLNLNVTSGHRPAAPAYGYDGDFMADADRVTVDIRVDLRDISALSRSLLRYGFEIIGADGSDVHPDDSSALENLLRYLSV